MSLRSVLHGASSSVDTMPGFDKTLISLGVRTKRCEKSPMDPNRECEFSIGFWIQKY